MTDLHWLDATAQAEMIRTGAMSAGELLAHTLARIDAINPALNAIIHRLDEAARRTPAQPGPFHGVPFLLKDIVSHSAGDPFHCGMQVLREIGHTEPDDTWLTQRFRDAGFVLVGKTNTPELATSITCEPIAYGATRNPWDPTRTPGGSSGGSAAAVAAGLVAVAHANDMGGSIRIPASACGLIGLKPTRARSTLGPHLGELWGPLTHEHVVARSVRDCAAVLDAIAGAGIGDPYNAAPPSRRYLAEVGADPGRLRIGVRTRIPGTDRTAHADCVAAVDNTLVLLESLGHVVTTDEVDGLDRQLDDGVSFAAWVAAEVDRIGRRIGRVIAPHELEPPNAIIVERGRSVKAADYLAASDRRHAWVRGVVAAWHGDAAIDVLVTPTMPTPPFRLGVLDPATVDPITVIRGVGEQVCFTNPWNNTGQPAISLPIHWTTGDRPLPIGVQFVAAPGREDLLLRLAAQLEQAQTWGNRHPPAPPPHV